MSEYGGVPLAEKQAELTPFQRMVIQLEATRQNEQNQQQQAGGGSQIMNSHPGAGQTIEGDTTTYVNEGAK